MKKIFFLLLTILIIVVIYILNIDSKIYVFSIGDSIAIGKVDLKDSVYSYDDFIKKEFDDDNKLEKYVNTYQKPSLRMNDVINDINSNKKIAYSNKTYNIKNILIKSDLVIISINNDVILDKISNYYNINELYTWGDEIIIEYEKMINLIRNYCKEKVIVVGNYYPNNFESNNEIVDFIHYLNSEFLEISQIYNVDYINTYTLLNKDNLLIGTNYPTKLGYNTIGEEIIKKYNN